MEGLIYLALRRQSYESVVASIRLVVVIVEVMVLWMDGKRPKFDFRLGTNMDLDLNFEA